MIILGIETSCDETAAAIVQDGTKIIANIVASSQDLHIKTKGVIPEVAAREQLKCIIPVITEVLNTEPEKNINAIAVTVGPGLIGSLLVGVETAKTLAYTWNKPIIPVNHLIGHIYTNFVNPNLNLKEIFPAIVLIVSGGHTELLLMRNHGKFQFLGGTRDDAAGECFDKCARLLGLPYPGGPAIAAKAAKMNYESRIMNKKSYALPRPMMDQDNFEFSFSGLKTAVLNLVNNRKLSSLQVSEISCEIEEAITDCLINKTLKAVNQFQVKSLILGGGVTANEKLRKKFREKIAEKKLPITFFVPENKLSTDNAVGISSAAFFNYSPIPWQKITADPGLEII